MTLSSITSDRRDQDNIVMLATVPKVRLCAESPMEQGNWLVHIAHVTDRGRWQTAPHTHPRYGQVIFVRSGCGAMNLEGRSVPFEGPCVLLLPMGCMHALNYEIDADRWVVTVEPAYLTQLKGKLHEFILLWAGARMIPLSYVDGEEAEFYGTIKQLEHEVASRAVGHVVGTEALLTSLLLMLVRINHDQMGDGGASHNEIRLVDRFRQLIDLHYRNNLPLHDYASMLAVSLAQLRVACAAATGQNPTKMVHARIITEAKRNLIFGDMSIEQIAFSLDFSDAAYFARFFRKEAGQTPSQFRVSARDQLQHGK